MYNTHMRQGWHGTVLNVAPYMYVSVTHMGASGVLDINIYDGTIRHMAIAGAASIVSIYSKPMKRKKDVYRLFFASIKGATCFNDSFVIGRAKIR